jgi:hypothetical protein
LFRVEVKRRNFERDGNFVLFCFVQHINHVSQAAVLTGVQHWQYIHTSGSGSEVSCYHQQCSLAVDSSVYLFIHQTCSKMFMFDQGYLMMLSWCRSPCVFS